MAVLSNRLLSKVSVLNPDKSKGPFVAFDDDLFYFDATSKTPANWLGNFASALFGVAQHLESFTGENTRELKRIKAAYDSQLQRTKSAYFRNLNLGGDDELDPAALIHRYISLSTLDQYEQEHRKIVASIARNVTKLAEEFDEFVSSIFIDGANFSFRFSLTNESLREAFDTSLQCSGILTGSDSANDEFESHQRSFSLNLSFRGDYLALFWQRLRLALEKLRNPSLEIEPISIAYLPNLTNLFNFHESLRHAKCLQQLPSHFDPIEMLQLELDNRFEGMKAYQVSPLNYPHFRDRILQMQAEVYEPTRRTPPEEFDMLFASEKPLAIIVCQADKIAAMVFAGRLGLFRGLHNGIETDPFRDDPTVYYSMDLTVAEQFRGGLGRLMKQAQVMLAIEHGLTGIHGRNRDRLAAGMWAINLSLGSYELQRLANDYDDDEQYRDCIYYRCPLIWYSDVPIEKLQAFPVHNVILGKGFQRSLFG